MTTQPEVPPEETTQSDETQIVPYENVHRWINTTYRGGVLLVILLSGVYAFFPIDAIPDLLPLAGQVDDLIVLLSGGTTVGVMTALRPLVAAIMKRPLLRTGCFLSVGLVLTVMLAGAVLVFYGLYSLFNSIF